MTTRPRIAVSPKIPLLLTLPLLMIIFAACTANVTYKGLKPLYPAYPDSYTWNSGNPYDNVVIEVDSLQPSLEWESFPRQRYILDKGGKMLDRIRNVSYELQIFGPASELVYERKGLSTPHHTVESPLQPLSKYLWSVRARFDLDGHPKVTGWGEMIIDVQAKDFVPRNVPYSFKTPEAK